MMKVWKDAMKIFDTIRKNMRLIILMIVLVVVSFSLGTYAGIALYKDRLSVVSAGLWGKGVNIAKKSDYDFALYYFSQAIALNKEEPLFYHSMAETYEAKQNVAMALKFYNLALEQYKRTKTGPINLVESKIKLLQGRDGK
ncbi:MAG: hypothetical protein HZA17_14450 [Nitrospirae bacterium]|nr:hypothetical protein [Nitrospirota bacterium]